MLYVRLYSKSKIIDFLVMRNVYSVLITGLVLLFCASCLDSDLPPKSPGTIGEPPVVPPTPAQSAQPGNLTLGVSTQPVDSSFKDPKQPEEPTPEDSTGTGGLVPTASDLTGKDTPGQDCSRFTIDLFDDPQAYLTRVEDHISMEQYDEASCVLRAFPLGASRSKNAEKYFLYGEVWKERGDSLRAIDQYKTAIEEDETAIASYAALMELYNLIDGKFNAAEELYREYLESGISRSEKNIEEMNSIEWYRTLSAYNEYRKSGNRKNANISWQRLWKYHDGFEIGLHDDTRLDSVKVLLIDLCSTYPELRADDCADKMSFNRQRGGVLSYFEVDLPAIIDPYLVDISSSNYERLFGFLYEPLIEYDYDKGDYTGVLAESYEFTDDGIIFSLKSGVFWNSPDKSNIQLTALDVSKSFDNLKENGKGGRREFYGRNIKSVEALGNNKVIFKFNNYIKNNKHFLKYCTFRIVKKHKDNIIGTGPFRLNNKSNEVISLVSSQDYWNQSPNLDYLYIKEFSSSIKAIDANFGDVTDNEDPNFVNIIAETPPLISLSPDVEENVVLDNFVSNPHSFQAIILNTRKPPFDNVEFRQALDLVIQKQFVLNRYYKEQGYVMASPFGKKSQYYDPSFESFRFDPHRATEMIESSGVDYSGTYDLLIKEESGIDPVNYDKVADDLRQYFSNVDISLKIVGNDFSNEEYRAALRDGNFHMAIVQWSFKPSYDIGSLFHSMSKYNYAGLSNPLLDALIEQYTQSYEEQETKLLAKKIVQEVQLSMPYIFLFHVDYKTSLNYTIFGTDRRNSNVFENIQNWYQRIPPYGLPMQ